LEEFVRKLFLLLFVSLASLVAFGQTESAAQKADRSGNSVAPPMLGIYWANDHRPPARKPPSPKLIWNRGEIMPTATVHPIFWGPRWADPVFAADKITGIDTFYLGFGGSGYAHASNEYTGTNGQITSVVSYTGYTTDGTTAVGGSDTAAILSEVCRVIGTAAVHNGFYPVYVDLVRGPTDRYCGYHSAGTCNGVIVQFAFIWNLDGDRCGDPVDTLGLHSQGLSAIANVSAHEFSEARTNPNNGGWRNAQQYENADICGSPTPIPHDFVTFSNGSRWKLQALWSNHAYDTGTGFPDSIGELGCIDN
jgi:hypothetical protein